MDIDQFQKQVDAMYLRALELSADDKYREASEAAEKAYLKINWDGTFEEFKTTFDTYMNAERAANEAYNKYVELSTAKTLPPQEFKIALR